MEQVLVIQWIVSVGVIYALIANVGITRFCLECKTTPLSLLPQVSGKFQNFIDKILDIKFQDVPCNFNC